MTNPFEIIDKRLSNIESLLLDLKHRPTATTDTYRSPWLNLDEFCKYHPDKPAKPTVYSWVSKGEVPFHKKGKHLYFLLTEIDSWLAAGRKRTNSEIKAEAEAELAALEKNRK